MVDDLSSLMFLVNERPLYHTPFNLQHKFKQFNYGLSRLLFALNHMINWLSSGYGPETSIELVWLECMCPFFLDLEQLSQISHPLLIELIILLEYYVLQLLKLPWIRSEYALDNMIVKLFLIQLFGFVQEHKVLLQILHHVPLTQKVSCLVEHFFYPRAHWRIKICDNGSGLFTRELD